MLIKEAEAITQYYKVIQSYNLKEKVNNED